MEEVGIILESKSAYLMNAGCRQKSIENHNHNLFGQVAFKGKEKILHDTLVNFVKKLLCVSMYFNCNSFYLGN